MPTEQTQVPVPPQAPNHGTRTHGRRPSSRLLFSMTLAPASVLSLAFITTSHPPPPPLPAITFRPKKANPAAYIRRATNPTTTLALFPFILSLAK